MQSTLKIKPLTQTEISSDWHTVCQSHDLVDNSGVCALINDTQLDQQVALFKCKSPDLQQVFAVSNWDPVGKANVIYRGLIGSVDKQLVVISPLYKQRFCLATGQCLDADEHRLTVYPCRVVDDQVQLKISA